MQAETKNKLTVLHNVGRITDDELRSINEIDRFINQSLEITDDEMLLIHLASTLERIRLKSKIDELPEELWQQIIDKPQYDSARVIFENFKDYLPVILPNAEVRYIMMHIVNILRR